MEHIYSLDKFFLRKARLLLVLSLMLCLEVFSQNQKKLDSLEQIYLTGKYEPADQLEILSQLADQRADLEKALIFSDELIAKAQELDSLDRLYGGYFNKGNALVRKGDLSDALESYFKSAQIAADQKNDISLGNINIAIADVYSIMGNHDNAVYYYRKSIQIHGKNNNQKRLATAIENLGDEYLNVAKPDSALIMFEQSGPIFKTLGFTEGIAMNIGNKGIAYALLGKDEMAKDNINHAIIMFEKIENYYPICVFLTYMSDLYLNQDDWNSALAYAQRSLELAEKYGLKDEISAANLQISKLYEASGDFGASLKYFKNYTAYKDSVNNISAVQQMANIRTDYEVSQKQVEVDLLNQQKRNQRILVIVTVIALVLICIVAFGLFKRNRFVEKTKKIIEDERNRSDKLLLNILPEETALELKDNGRVIPKKFDSVTVMFTDFEAFTKYSQNLTPELLVKSVDYHFSKFDEIIEKYGLEKIKTIGDSYMCAGGLPFPSEDHAEKMLQAAFEISEFIDSIKNSEVREITHFDIRIGIHTGPVVAGVVGTKKFAYDIWGDTVNIASRLESNSQPGKINVSESTYMLIKDSFDCEYRGEIEAKNKGMMKMYYVNKKKEDSRHFSKDNKTTFNSNNTSKERAS